MELTGLPQPPKRYPGRLAIGPRLMDGSFTPQSKKRQGPRLPNGDFLGGRHLRKLRGERNRQRLALVKAFRKMALAKLRAQKAALRAARVKVPRVARIRTPRPKQPKRARAPRKPKNARPKRGRTGRSSKGKQYRGGRTVFRASFSGWLVRTFVKVARKMAKGRKSDFRNHGFKGSGKGGYTGFAGMR